MTIWGVRVRGGGGGAGRSFFVTGHQLNEGLSWESANPKNIVTKYVSPVKCLLCLLVLQIYFDCVYLHCKFIVTASICTLCEQ